jgi:hypothetical protein
MNSQEPPRANVTDTVGTRIPSAKTSLRVAVVLELVFALTGVVASLLLESELPQPLKEWVAAEAKRDFNSSDAVLLALGIPIVVAWLVSSVGLFLFRRWAAWLYLWTTLLGLTLYPLLGPNVEHGLTESFYLLSSAFSGAVVALSFLSGVLVKTKASHAAA